MGVHAGTGADKHVVEAEPGLAGAALAPRTGRPASDPGIEPMTIRLADSPKTRRR